MAAPDPSALLEPARRAGEAVSQTYRRHYGPLMFAMVLCSLAWGAGIVAWQAFLRERDAVQQGIVRLLDMDIAPPRGVTKLAALAGAVQLLSNAGDDLSSAYSSAFAGKSESQLRRYAKASYPEAPVELRPCSAGRHAKTAAGNTALYVPAQLADLGPDSQEVDRQAARAAARAAGLESLALALQDDRYEIVQSYYVTSGGISAYWSPDSITACDHYSDDYLSLSERPYMVALRQASSELPAVRLPLYLDAGGRGLVASTCVADRLGGAFQGAFCLDFRPRSLNSLAPGTILRAPPLQGTVVQKALPLDAMGLGVSCTSDEPACSVPLLMDSKRWLQITVEDPRRFEFWLWLFLSAAALATVVQALRHTHAWRVAEARLGMLRDLPAAVLEVERGPTGRIIAASDRAEELLGRSLPSFVDRNSDGTSIARAVKRLLRLVGLVDDGRAPVTFWGLFERFGFAIDLEVALSQPPATGPLHLKLEPDLCECVAGLRRAGLASTYFVCRLGKPPTEPSSWLRVTGTPELFATSGAPRSFSLIHELNHFPLNEYQLSSVFPGGKGVHQRAAE